MTASPTRWTPLLQGRLARQARDAAVAIGDALARLPPHAPSNPSLASGSAGIGLALCCLHETFGDREYDRAARLHIRAALEHVARTPISSRFLTGATGVAWTALHTRAALHLDDADPLIEQLDAVLSRRLQSDAPFDRFDLGSGLVGWGVYAAEPRPWSRHSSVVATIVERLHRHGNPQSDHRPWFTPGQALSPTVRPFFPDGHHDLGLAHGVAGVVGWLSGLHRVPDLWPRARSLGTAAMQYLLEQRLPEGGFPSFAGQAPKSARVAWCYGDPGIAIAIAAARRLQPSALDVARRLAERRAIGGVTSTGAVDCGLCHGAAGLGHVFHRLARVCRSPILFRAAERWFGRVLDQRCAGLGVGGFQSYRIEPTGGTWRDDASLLTGSAGIALALSAAISDRRPHWDRALLFAIEDGDDEDGDEARTIHA